jgi:hypothetical protein
VGAALADVAGGLQRPRSTARSSHTSPQLSSASSTAVVGSNPLQPKAGLLERQQGRRRVVDAGDPQLVERHRLVVGFAHQLEQQARAAVQRLGHGAGYRARA